MCKVEIDRIYVMTRLHFGITHVNLPCMYWYVFIYIRDIILVNYLVYMCGL